MPAEERGPFERCYSPKTGKSYIGTRPSKKRIQWMMAAISAETDEKLTWKDADDVVETLNRKLVGWANYFCLGPVSKAYKALDAHATSRLRRWLCKKHKVANRGNQRYPSEYLHTTLGLVCLPTRTANLPWANV